ncbi:MAG: amidohydrolase family protein [Acidimicrobiaceae bacterium]|jgi:imidazolonepropionase-like amidohydrolase|nr:amidohydrolase family protein [Acidimicrobiaceae bacterium]MBT5580154.1 amidohydrolase family protein [Acidimicrobiaceae bacterium]MBT5852081.1 amidohydrolase family protein [Acidimicrobiaceae bacterium]
METLLIGGRVFDGVNIVSDETGVLIDGGVITRVAPAAEFESFSGKRIDTEGGTVMPGLIDCHVHLCLGGEGDPRAMREGMDPGHLVLSGLKRAQATLAGGITAIRDCGGKDYLEFAIRDACNSGAQLGPTIRAAGKMICMTGGHGNGIGRVADGVDDVIKAVREQIHAGSDFVKLMATGGVLTPGVNPEDAHFTFEEISSGIHEAHRFNKRTASHAQGTEGILNATRGGVDSIEHGMFMTDECVEEMLKRGTYLVPTLAAGYKIENDEGLRASLPPFVMAKLGRILGRSAASMKLFYDAGGKIAMGTDAGVPFCMHGENARELEYMVEAGMSAIDALIAGTSNAADLVALENEGRLVEGNAADILVVDGDPTDDIRMAARSENHRLVLKRGVAVPGTGSGASL